MGIRSSGRTAQLPIREWLVGVEDIAVRSRHCQPVLCLHAAGSGSREFRPLLDRRPKGSRPILFDWPGHGRTVPANPAKTGNLPLNLCAKGETECPGEGGLTLDKCADLLHGVIQHLDLSCPILLGSGFGAAVAVHYAALYPRRVRGLVLCQPAGLIPAVAQNAPGFGRRLAKLLPILRRSGSRTPAERQALRRMALEPLMRPILAEADEALRRSAGSLRHELASIPCPVLFTLSRDSRQYPLKRYLALLDPLLKSAPQHRFTVFRGACHPLWDEPERFAHAVTGFIQALFPVERHSHAWMIAAVDWPAANTNLWKCVHPDCPEERVLRSGENANARP